MKKALRYNAGKPKWSLVHYKSLLPLVRVLEVGASKYAPFNWQKPFPKDELKESLMRHVVALMDGEEYDKESGQHHIGHGYVVRRVFNNFSYLKHYILTFLK